MIPNACAQPFQRMYIDCRGDVYPCCVFYRDELLLGNIKKETIEELWHCDKIKKLRKSLMTRRFNLACKRCLLHEVN